MIRRAEKVTRLFVGGQFDGETREDTAASAVYLLETGKLGAMIKTTPSDPDTTYMCIARMAVLGENGPEYTGDEVWVCDATTIADLRRYGYHVSISKIEDE